MNYCMLNLIAFVSFFNLTLVALMSLDLACGLQAEGLCLVL